jgi:hypothetical protein
VGNATGNNTFNATDATSASNPNGVATFGSLDSITGQGANNVFNVVYSNHNITQVVGATVTGVQTANLVSNGSITENTSAWTGLTALNATTSTVGQTLVAAATTNVNSTATGGTTAIDGGLAVTATNDNGAITIGANTAPAGAISVTETTMGAYNVAVDGGTTVSVTATGNTGGGITIGANTAPTGTITVANTVSSGTGGNIAVTGGTVDTITQTTSNAVGTLAYEGNVTVTGATTTTSVVVNQAQATAAAAQSAIAGVVAATGVTAAPGVTGVTQVTGVAQVSAQAGVVGASSGTVSITDANAGKGIANTITSVTLNNYNNNGGLGTSSITDDALSTLSLKGVGGALNITNTNASNSTLNLTVNGLTNAAGTGSAGAITDVKNLTKTLNVTTTGANSNLASFNDSALTTLNVSGTNVLTMGVNSTNNAALTTVKVTGSAGFNDGGVKAGSGLASLGAQLTSFTTTSSGQINAVLDATTQTFKGSTGTDVITISDTADATQTITAGSAKNNELILDGGKFALTAANTGANVTGFEILGVTSTVTGTVDMSQLASGFNALDVIGSAGVTFTNVATNSSVAIDNSTTGTVAVNYIDGTGLNDVVGLTLGTSSTAAGITVNALTLQDVNGVGVGTVNLVSNDTKFNDVNTITTLTDNGLLTLNVSGTGGLTIGGLSETTAAAATTFTIHNTETNAAGVTLTTFQDNSLATLDFTGSNATTITTLSSSSSSAIAINNTGTSTATIGTFTDNSATSVTLGAGVTLGQGATTKAETLIGLQDSGTAGIAVYGSSDNAHVTVNLTVGAAAGKADTITLGNGNNYVADATAAGTVNVTVGTGSNMIVLGGTNTDTTGVYNVTLGAHTAATGIDSISIGSQSVTAVGSGNPWSPAGANLTVTGAVTGDAITFANDVATLTIAATATTAGSTVAATVSAIEAAALSTLHQVTYSVFGGNTYVAEAQAATGGAANSALTVIELVGSHTFTGAGAGVVHVA